MIVNWDYGFPAACDSAYIISGIYWLSFSSSKKRSTSLKNIGKTFNFAPPMTVVALDGVMVLVLALALN